MWLAGDRKRAVEEVKIPGRIVACVFEWFDRSLSGLSSLSSSEGSGYQWYQQSECDPDAGQGR